jgi:N-methylhydantoinase A
VQAAYDVLTDRAGEALAREGFAPGQRVFERTADLRYVGQAYEVRVAVPEGPVTEDLLASVAEAFHDEHRALYGYDNRADVRQEVEWVNLRICGIGPLRTPVVPRVPAGSGARSARTGSRTVHFDDWVDADLFDRRLLGAGDELEGPAVVEEFSSTVPVHPGFTARVDDFGNLVIRRSAG